MQLSNLTTGQFKPPIRSNFFQKFPAPKKSPPYFKKGLKLVFFSHCAMSQDPISGNNSIVYIIQSKIMVEGSACKPALVQDTNYMVEKTYHIAPYLGALGAY